MDKRRSKIFELAIKKTVRHNHIVVDAGTGTGIMALFAARSGARKVYAIEQDKEIAKIARHNIKNNGYGHIISVINSDIIDFKMPDKRVADVVVMEMLDTGLIAEQQAKALMCLKRNHVIKERTILLPEKVDLMIRVIDYNFDFYGFNLPTIIQARNYGAIKGIKKTLSNFFVYAPLDFRKLTSTRIERRINIDIIGSGITNAVELRTNIYLREKRYTTTTDMNMPVIIPMKRKKVTTGNRISLSISYNMGDGLGKMKLNWI